AAVAANPRTGQHTPHRQSLYRSVRGFSFDQGSQVQSEGLNCWENRFASTQQKDGLADLLGTKDTLGRPVGNKGSSIGSGANCSAPEPQANRQESWKIYPSGAE